MELLLVEKSFLKYYGKVILTLAPLLWNYKGWSGVQLISVKVSCDG